ncbi:HAD-IA family hydrolase [Sediminispirochaeta smaragdinae]|jgi:putative hydrolase of the HAD superfamily|uniref:HAD-superfamily hydrolase, subfamily IA, variant 3 n=1 Tax=Sediminispirochaeta smaragdinae (strain DSM 11293 / JCM 15392 / SEBR 4228) TaxID=573413 RepID=E1R7X0_SEDSS|nr:HAD-IA family hydrolase [Sediminispirochaeta smaragdinae]ADK82825.1 HAD-superfamily hydrolase, subfamily IA, variant 3 [Sediminispirochaeta smaragdinae DSM 11293]
MQISYILFDLDDTLYPSSSGLALAFKENILSFVSDYLKLPVEEAEAVRKVKRKEYGTTLEWLQKEKGLENPDSYFEAIHPKDVGRYLKKDPVLVELIKRIPQRTSILTNSPMEHAVRVSEFLEIRHLMEHIFDLRSNSMLGKPDWGAYKRALDTIRCRPEEVLFVDDMPRYLYAFREMGGHVLLVDESGRHKGTDLDTVTSIHQIETVLR